MEQTYHIVLSCNFLHKLHCELIMVCRDICCFVNGGKFMLSRSNFIMLGFRRNTQFPQGFVKLGHECLNTGLNSSEIVVAQLLSFRTSRTEKRTPRINKILSRFKCTFVDQEILLFRTDRNINAFHIIISEELQNAKCLSVERFHGTQQRCLFIECMTAVGAKCGRNA